MQHKYKLIHNRFAPYWAVGLLILGITGITTTWIRLETF